MYDSALQYKPKLLSLSAIVPAQRVNHLRQYYGGIVGGREIEPLDGHSLHIDMAVTPLPGVGLGFGNYSGVRTQRTRQLAADGNDAILLLSHSTGFISGARGREPERLQANDVLAADFGEHAESIFDRGGAVRSVWVDRKRLTTIMPGFDFGAIGRLPAGTPGVELLFAYAELATKHGDATPETMRLTSAHLIDLVALVLGAMGDAAELVRNRGLKAARLAAIKADLAVLFHTQGLSVATLAAKHGISTRYVQMLFEEEGTTFTEYLQSLRLEFAMRRLGETRHFKIRVADIAFEAGFSELTAFNRLFRRRFGDTPTGARNRG